MKVDVYFNLHRKLFSIRACEGPNKGRVIAHRETVTLLRPQFKVSQAGRARVLREKRKNVHATVRGQWLYHDLIEDYRSQIEASCKNRGVEITYNPYKMSSFSYWNDIQELHGFHYAEAAFLCVKTKTQMALYPSEAVE